MSSKNSDAASINQQDSLSWNMEPPIPLKSVVLFIACGTMVFVIVFIFAKRQITRFTLKASRAPHATIGADAPKTLRQEIERRLKRVADIQFEPRLLSNHVEHSLSAGFNGEPCNLVYRVKAVDALQELDVALKEYSANIRRPHRRPSLRPFLLELRQSGPLTGIKIDVIEKFSDAYDHARHDPVDFEEHHYVEYMNLLQELTNHIGNRKNPSEKNSSDPVEMGATPGNPDKMNPRENEDATLIKTAEDAMQQEVTYRPRLRRTGAVNQSTENVEMTANRHSGGSSSLDSEARSESATSSAHDSTETETSLAGSMKLTRVGESVV